MKPAIRIMRLSILAALGLSASSAFAQETSQQGSVPACENPKPIRSELVTGSGFVRCEDGRVLREKAIWDLPGNPGPKCDVPADELLFHECLSDSECGDRPFGNCTLNWNFGPGASCVCEYRCMSDLDCRIGEICAASEVSGTGFKKCVAAVDCRANLDCPSGQCEVSQDRSILGGGGAVTLGCRSERDKCQSDADCAGIGCETCDLNPRSKVWECSEVCLVPGRPFLVHGEAALAEVRAGSDWIDASYAGSTSLREDQAELAANYWLDSARMEHASVAAFARFALQLMHLGAPPELLVSTTQAMHDEIAHAKACFGLAKRYSGASRSADTLEVSQALEHELEPVQIALDVFLEGCVGESVAALVASEMGRLTTDPQVGAILDKIAKDEHEHALLAWRSLSWMLSTLPATQVDEIVDILTKVVAGLEQEAAGGEPEVPSALETELEQHGVPSRRRQAQLRQQTLAQLVVPCAKTLLAEHASGSPDLAEPGTFAPLADVFTSARA